MLEWVSDLVRAPGTLQSPVKGFHRTIESELHKSLHGWDLEELLPGRSLSPDETYYKKMFEAPPRTWSEYSLRPVPMLSALIVLGSSTVELNHRICGRDCKRVRRFQLGNPAYNNQSAIDVIIGTHAKEESTNLDKSRRGARRKSRQMEQRLEPTLNLIDAYRLARLFEFRLIPLP